MPNPFAALNPNNPMRGYNFDNIRQTLGMLRGQNPMQALSQMAMSNPSVQPIVQALNQGANPQQVFYSLCQQRGINPQEFLRNITDNSGQYR